MPSDNRVGLHQNQGPAPIGPEVKGGHPQESVRPQKRDSSSVALENGELVPESKDLELQRCSCPERRGQPGEK